MTFVNALTMLKIHVTYSAVAVTRASNGSQIASAAAAVTVVTVAMIEPTLSTFDFTISPKPTR
jgi:cephalosporin-C deacetylase-like acetyl esterase